MYNINDFIGKYTIVLMDNGAFAIDNENGTYTIYAETKHPQTIVGTLADLI